MSYLNKKLLILISFLILAIFVISSCKNIKEDVVGVPKGWNKECSLTYKFTCNCRQVNPYAFDCDKSEQSVEGICKGDICFPKFAGPIQLPPGCSYKVSAEGCGYQIGDRKR